MSESAFQRVPRFVSFFSVLKLTEFLYVTIDWKQWLLSTEAVQYVFRQHNGRADPAVWWHTWICPTIVMSIHMLGSHSRE